jgi:hypothetical protein
LEEVADYEMASYTGSRVDIVDIAGEEGPDISDLQDEEDNPMGMKLAEGSMKLGHEGCTCQ